MSAGFLIMILLVILIPSGAAQGIKIKITSKIKNEIGRASCRERV